MTLKVLVPLTNAASEGNTALESLAVMCTVSLVLTRFQLASTLLTVMLKGVPDVCADAVPVLPLAVPGTAVSPGTSTCNLASAPAATEIVPLVLDGFVLSTTSLAVTV